MKNKEYLLHTALYKKKIVTEDIEVFYDGLFYNILTKRNQTPWMSELDTDIKKVVLKLERRNFDFRALK